VWSDKTNRAKEHKKNLEAEIATFLNTNPYKVSTKIDAKTKRLIYYIQSADDLPKNIALTTGDIIQNLRSSLDQLAYQLFLQNSGSTAQGRHIQFPISMDLSGYEARKGTDTNGISSQAKNLIDAIKPYRGGNDRLWQIHELSNIDKHRTLVTVGSSYRSMDLGAHMSAAMKEAFPDRRIPSISAFFKPADSLFPLAVGKELFIDRPDAKPLPDMQFRFDIALNEPGIVDGEPLLEAVQAMIDTVGALVPTFSHQYYRKCELRSVSHIR